MKLTRPDGLPFWLDRTEVTVAAYRECVDAAACSAPVTSDERPRELRPTPHAQYDNVCRTSNMTWDLPDHDHYPINCVTFEEAFRYCRFRGGTLPDEDEWEAGFRGTTQRNDRRFPWDHGGPSCQRAVMRDERGPGCGKGGPWPVGSKPLDRSPIGALDMAGNVSEIVITGENPTWEPMPDTFDSVGGSYVDSSVSILNTGASWPSPTVGFRCVYHLPGHGPRYRREP